MSKSIEVMIVDDSGDWNERLSSALTQRQYLVTSYQDSYKAISNVAVRLQSGIALPDVYVCDMLDRNYLIAKRCIEEKMEDIYLNMAFNLNNFLKASNIEYHTYFFLAVSAELSSEDIATAKQLRLPLVRKDDQMLDWFPDTSSWPECGRRHDFGSQFALKRWDKIKSYASSAHP